MADARWPRAISSDGNARCWLSTPACPPKLPSGSSPWPTVHMTRSSGPVLGISCIRSVRQSSPDSYATGFISLKAASTLRNSNGLLDHWASGRKLSSGDAKSFCKTCTTRGSSVGVTSCISSRRQVAHPRADEVSCGPLLEKFASTTAPPRQSRVRDKCETGRTAHSLTGVSTMNAIVSHRGSNLARAILGAGSGCLAHTSTNRLHALSTRRHDRRVGDMSRASIGPTPSD